MSHLSIDTEHYASWLKNGIIHMTYKAGTIVTIDIARQMVKCRLEITDGVTRPLFVDIRGMISVEGEARKYLAGNEAIRYVSAGAIYLDNYLHYLAGNVFLKIDKPAIPSKLFTDKEKALRWLELFKNLN